MCILNINFFVNNFLLLDSNVVILCLECKKRTICDGKGSPFFHIISIMF